MTHRTHSAATLFAIATFGSALVFAQDAPYDQPSTGTTTTTTVTNATGAISQLNYGADGAVEGFLLGSNLLLEFRTNVSAGIGSLGSAGNGVTYSGTSYTTSSGFQTVEVTSFTNNTTKATYSSSAHTTVSSTYGPTTGTIKQLNYNPDGSIDGFIFAPTGGAASVFVQTGTVTNTTLKAALTVGASVSVTGTTFTPPGNSCSAIGALTVVDPGTLVIGGTNYVLTGGDGHGFGPGGPGRGRH